MFIVFFSNCRLKVSGWPPPKTLGQGLNLVSFFFLLRARASKLRQCVKHSVAWSMAASQLPQLRGCAAEACFKAIAVGKHRGTRPEMPVEFYVRYDDGTEELRRDASILQEMWVLCHKIVHVLASKGITLRFAQSTYHRRSTNAAGGDKDKLERNSFCVDLTVLFGGKIFWLEFKYSEAADWAEILQVAEESVKFWKTDVLKSPRTWRLDDNLSGAVLRKPHGLGTLIANFRHLRLELKDDHFLLEVAIAQQPPASAAPARPARRRKAGVDTRSTAHFLAERTKRTRKRKRQLLEQTEPVLRKPSGRTTAARSAAAQVLSNS